MKNKKIFIGVAAVAVVGIIIAMIASSGKDSMDMSKMSDTSDSASSAVSTNMVSIKNYMFTPAVIKVKVGTKVTWTNTDAVSHNIVADNPSSDAPNTKLFAKGESVSFTFNKAGTYTYHCFPHPYMHGTVEVVN
jgi:amicyanin